MLSLVAEETTGWSSRSATGPGGHEDAHRHGAHGDSEFGRTRGDDLGHRPAEEGRPQDRAQDLEGIAAPGEADGGALDLGPLPVPIGDVLVDLLARLDQGHVERRNLQDYDLFHPVAAEDCTWKPR